MTDEEMTDMDDDHAQCAIYDLQAQEWAYQAALAAAARAKQLSLAAFLQ